MDELSMSNRKIQKNRHDNTRTEIRILLPVGVQFSKMALNFMEEWAFQMFRRTMATQLDKQSLSEKRTD
ncbi:1961_t:CDS:2 [Funneliformis caledonium]|uniref:1961_t:CDS:1 n=1 Tax=Funneliformis caledonium TaxID=1117310 RepID=A0A9N9EBY4_9GLOM|nr:1961_t:CDS:2 [Funneliformis caledonium]